MKRELGSMGRDIYLRALIAMETHIPAHHIPTSVAISVLGVLWYCDVFLTTIPFPSLHRIASNMREENFHH